MRHLFLLTTHLFSPYQASKGCFDEGCAGLLDGLGCGGLADAVSRYDGISTVHIVVSQLGYILASFSNGGNNTHVIAHTHEARCTSVSASFPLRLISLSITGVSKIIRRVADV